MDYMIYTGEKRNGKFDSKTRTEKAHVLLYDI